MGRKQCSLYAFNVAPSAVPDLINHVYAAWDLCKLIRAVLWVIFEAIFISLMLLIVLSNWSAAFQPRTVLFRFYKPIKLYINLYSSTCDSKRQTEGRIYEEQRLTWSQVKQTRDIKTEIQKLNATTHNTDEMFKKSISRNNRKQEKNYTIVDSGSR